MPDNPSVTARIIFTLPDAPSSDALTTLARFQQLGRLQENLFYGIRDIVDDRSMREDVGARWSKPLEALQAYVRDQHLQEYEGRLVDSTGSNPALLSIYNADYRQPNALLHALGDNIHGSRAAIIPTGLSTSQMLTMLKTPAIADILRRNGNPIIICELNGRGAPGRFLPVGESISLHPLDPSDAFRFAMSTAGGPAGTYSTPPFRPVLADSDLSEGERARLNTLGEALGMRDHIPVLSQSYHDSRLPTGFDPLHLAMARAANEEAVLFELRDLIRAHPGPTALAQIQTELSASIENGRTFSGDRLSRDGIQLASPDATPAQRTARLIDTVQRGGLLGEETRFPRAAVLADAEAVVEAGSRARSGNVVVSLALLTGGMLFGTIGAAQASPEDIIGSLKKALDDRQLSQTEADGLARDMMMLQAIGVRPDPIAHDTVAHLRKDMNDILNRHPGISKEFSDGFNRLITTLSGEQHAENIAPQHFGATTPKPGNQLG